MAAHFYGTVMVDEGKFRMWYYPVRLGARPSELGMGPAAYAESEDGIRWIKPSLKQVSIKGNLENNAIRLPDDRVMGVTVIKDEEETDPERRYKMVYNPVAARDRWAEPKLNGLARSTLRTATSRDGLTWTARPDLPLDVFVELSSFFKHNGLYLAHGQGKLFGEGGELHERRGYAWVSTDFENWLAGQAETFGLPEPRTLGPRGAAGEYDQVHLGVGGTSYGSVVVGLYGIWRQGGAGVGGTTCDLGLVVSNDGIHFREPVRKHVYISRHDSPVTPVAGKDYPTILCQANGILNVDDETWIYHGRWRNAPVGPEYYGEVALATLPRDRWGAVGLIRGVSEGWVWSAPFRLAGGGGPGLSERRFRIANAGRGVRRRFQSAPRLLRCQCRHGLLYRKRGVVTEAERRARLFRGLARRSAFGPCGPAGAASHPTHLGGRRPQALRGVCSR